MDNSRMRIILISTAVLILAGPLAIAAQTWRLGQDSQLKQVSAEGEDKYLLAVAQIKQLISKHQDKKAAVAIANLKRDFPEIAGPDLDAFMQAEMLFAKGKWAKAVKSYDKFLVEYPKSSFYEAALDREYMIATAFLAGQRIRVLKMFKIRGYSSGEKTMDRIIDRAGDAPIAMKAAEAVAKAYEKRGKFAKAFERWSQISSKWPTGRTGKQALLAMARCKHAAYRGPKYNATNLLSARSYYESFKQRYPEDAKKLEIDKKIEQINEQLAYKELCTAQYYQKTGSKQAANLYYQLVQDDWPDSTASKMAEEKVNLNEKIKAESKNDK